MKLHNAHESHPHPRIELKSVIFLILQKNKKKSIRPDYFFEINVITSLWKNSVQKQFWTHINFRNAEITHVHTQLNKSIYNLIPLLYNVYVMYNFVNDSTNFIKWYIVGLITSWFACSTVACFSKHNFLTHVIFNNRLLLCLNLRKWIS